MHAVEETTALPKQSIELPEDLAAFIEAWKSKPGNLIMVLHKVQEHFGYVPRDVAFEVAARLDVPLAKIYGVITFYHFFKLRKPGKHQIAVCMGTACYLKGGEDIIKEFETIVGIGLNQTTSDGLFSLEAVRCIGCCGLAPVLTVDGEVYGRVTKDQLAGIVAKYRGR
jgi:NADH-quinone oxidoreductase subunit E